ncbi:MAG TPA: SDR family oxidoreductase [Vicinamibacterales bacterium]|nr:SDR family oxidoreductase [Vicinamibacterales bacterium]
MKILILGGDGMLGHELLQSLGAGHDVRVTLRRPVAAYREFQLFSDRNAIGDVDATNLGRVTDVIKTAAPEAVINCVGLVKQRPNAKSSALAIQINALFPQQLRDLCDDAGARLIHFSTDCVFSGRTGNYRESDVPDATDVYGRSKLLGEVDRAPGLTLRTSIIGLELSHHASLIEWFLAQRGAIKGFRRAIYTGITTMEMARLVDRLLARHRDLHGVWHVASQPISKYDLLVKLAVALGRTDIEIVPDETFECDRSLRADAFHAATGYEPPGWDAMLAELAGEVRRRKHARTA